MQRKELKDQIVSYSIVTLHIIKGQPNFESIKTLHMTCLLT